jgi:regulator of replication initiation timing
MAVMIAPWNPDALLRIRGNAEQGEIQCSGINRSAKRRGSRCGFHKYKDNKDNIKVQKRLLSLASKAPSQVTLQDLTELAELCLCRDNHHYQKDDLAEEWMEMVEGFAAIQLAAATESESLPPARPVAPEPKHVKNPNSNTDMTSGLPTPPSSQTKSQCNTFPVSPLIHSPLAPPEFPFKPTSTSTKQHEDLIAERGTLCLENKMLTTAETHLAARLDEETNAKQVAEQELNDAQTKISNLSVEIGSLKARLAQVELDRTLAEDKLAKVTTDLEIQAQRYKNLLHKVKKVHDYKVQALDNQLAAANTKCASLEQEMDAKLSLASKERQSLSEELAKLKRQLEDATEQNRSLTTENADLEQQLRTTTQVLGQKHQRISMLERELEVERTKPLLVREGQEKQRGRSWLGRLGRWFRGRRSESQV